MAGKKSLNTRWTSTKAYVRILTMPHKISAGLLMYRFRGSELEVFWATRADLSARIVIAIAGAFPKGKTNATKR